jgi:hypothetical protein
MCITVAGDEKAEEAILQVWFDMPIKGITANRMDILEWQNISHSQDIYYLIVGNDCIAANVHIINDKTNTVYMLKPKPTDLEQHSHLPSGIVSTLHSCLRHPQE